MGKGNLKAMKPTVKIEYVTISISRATNNKLEHIKPLGRSKDQIIFNLIEFWNRYKDVVKS